MESVFLSMVFLAFIMFVIIWLQPISSQPIFYRSRYVMVGTVDEQLTFLSRPP